MEWDQQIKSNETEMKTKKTLRADATQQLGELKKNAENVIKSFQENWNGIGNEAKKNAELKENYDFFDRKLQNKIKQYMNELESLNKEWSSDDFLKKSLIDICTTLETEFPKKYEEYQFIYAQLQYFKERIELLGTKYSEKELNLIKEIIESL